MSWAAEHENELRKLHSDGLPFSSIGKLMGRTRNACIGKARRLGLTRAKTVAQANFVAVMQARRASRPERIRNQRKTRAERRPPEPPVMHIDDELIPLDQRKTLLELDSLTCKWPVGDPGTKGFFFCGAEALEGRPYCASHWARAYAKAPPEHTDRIIAPFDFRRRAA